MPVRLCYFQSSGLVKGPSMRIHIVTYKVFIPYCLTLKHSIECGNVAKPKKEFIHISNSLITQPYECRIALQRKVLTASSALLQHSGKFLLDRNTRRERIVMWRAAFDCHPDYFTNNMLPFVTEDTSWCAWDDLFPLGWAWSAEPSMEVRTWLCPVVTSVSVNMLLFRQVCDGISLLVNPV